MNKTNKLSKDRIGKYIRPWKYARDRERYESDDCGLPAEVPFGVEVRTETVLVMRDTYIRGLTWT